MQGVEVNAANLECFEPEFCHCVNVSRAAGRLSGLISDNRKIFHVSLLSSSGGACGPQGQLAGQLLYINRLISTQSACAKAT